MQTHRLLHHDFERSSQRRLLCLDLPPLFLGVFPLRLCGADLVQDGEGERFDLVAAWSVAGSSASEQCRCEGLEAVCGALAVARVRESCHRSTARC